MRKWMVAAILVAVLAFGGFYAGSPYLATKNLKESGLAGDTEALKDQIDFPSVRESLKSQMNAALMQKMQNDPEMADNPLAELGMVLMPAIVEQAVSAYVTPDGMAAMIRGERPPGMNDESEPASDQPGLLENPNTEYEMEWTDLNTFKVTAIPAEADRIAPAFVFERHGIFSWQLTEIELPDDFLRDS